MGMVLGPHQIIVSWLLVRRFKVQRVCIRFTGTYKAYESDDVELPYSARGISQVTGDVVRACCRASVKMSYCTVHGILQLRSFENHDNPKRP